MDYIDEIELLMNNYGDMKKEIKVLKNTGGDFEEKEKKLNFLDYCLSLLETYERELIMSICMNSISIRRYSRHSGFSRNFISKEKKRILVLFNKFFNIKFNS